MDSWTSTREVSFRLPGDRELEKTSAEKTRWTDQNFDAEFKKSLKRENKVGKRETVEHIALP